MCTCSPCRACEARGEGEGDSDWKYQLQAEIVVPVPLHRAVRAGDVHIEVQNAGVGKKLAERLCDPHCLLEHVARWPMPAVLLRGSTLFATGTIPVILITAAASTGCADANGSMLRKGLLRQ